MILRESLNRIAWKNRWPVLETSGRQAKRLLSTSNTRANDLDPIVERVTDTSPYPPSIWLGGSGLQVDFELPYPQSGNVP